MIENRESHLSHEYISQIEVEVEIEVTIKAGIGLIMSLEVIQDIIKTLGVECLTVLTIEVVMAIMHKVIKDTEDSTIMEEVAIEIKIIIEEGVGHLRDRIEVEDRSLSNSRSRSGSTASTNRDRIQCLECREYDHFAQECPVSLVRQTSRETEQMQQMFNMDEDQTIMQTSLMDTDEDELNITPMDTRGNLNL